MTVDELKSYLTWVVDALEIVAPLTVNFKLDDLIAKLGRRVLESERLLALVARLLGGDDEPDVAFDVSGLSADEQAVARELVAHRDDLKAAIATARSKKG